MNQVQKRLIAATVVFCAVVGAAIVAMGVISRGRQPAADTQSTEWQDLPPDTAAPDAAAQEAQLPTLTIGGKENPDVYLQSLDINVEVTGNIAATRYTMVFKNKTGRILEGVLTFPLPDERSVTHYALDINGKMREAVPVEKAKGTEVFEEIEQRRVDPGLLERVEGNNFRTRIYPIPANGTRTISIGYEEELTFERGLLYYRLPMAYPDSLENFALRATVLNSGNKPVVPESDDEISFDAAGENYVAALARTNYRPSRALVFALPAPADIPQVLMQSAQGSYYFLASVAPQIGARKKIWNDDLAIIWDVSLSGSQRNLQREIEILDIIFAEKKRVNVNLYFLNNRLVKQGEYKVADGNWDKLKNVLKTTVFDGGTDFSQIKLNDIAGDEILFFSDGLSTLSDADFIKNSKADRSVHCIVSSAKADYSAMKSIADKTKGKFVNVSALSPQKLTRELLYETPLFLGIEHSGKVREVYPSTATPVRGNFSIAGITNAKETELTLLFGFGNTVEKRVKVTLDAKNAAAQGNTYKIWAQKKIAELDLDYEKNRAELTELGQQFGIVTRNTSLIVLETADDYVQYGIEPPESEPELLAEYRRRKSGGTVKPRNNWAAQETGGGERALDRQPRTDVFGRGGFATDIDAILSGVGGLKSGGDGGARGSRTEEAGNGEGRKGVSGIGYGSGYGSGFGGGGGGIDDLLGGLMGGGGGGLDLKKRGELKVSSPDFLKGGALTGGRSRASIQRVVMQNMAALRYAYNRRLRDRPELGGKITVKFAVDEFGTVTYAQMLESTINDEELENTVLDRVITWNFDRIDKPGDMTEVVYPFVFDINGGTHTESDETKARIARGMIRRQAPEEAAERRRREAAVAAARNIPSSKDGVTLNGAVTAANNLKKWWNINFTSASESAKPKYPVPDGSVSSAANNMFSEKGDVTKSTKPDYMKTLTGKTADDYQTYLKLRDDNLNSPVYYFDMSAWFYARGDKETALRVLTSIADLELENASLYRLLGYRFKEYGEYALEKFVCKKVVQWRPMEPQSYRDYALALADNGEAQAALDSLYSLLTRQYSSNILNRSLGMEEVVVMELNRLIAKNPKLNVSKIDKRLITNIPVDVRVVINWNMDNTDIDLHVKDPSGAECYYSNRQTGIGGRISNDLTDGYGPEQFILKRAVSGKYNVYVNYYSDRQFTSAGPSTIMAEIYTKYADKTERRKVVSLQMSNANRTAGGKVEVAEFEF